MPEAGDPTLIGRTVAGKFVVEKYIGGGSMGAVYRARQSALEKNVALKVMHRAVAVEPAFAARFHREAKAASRLDHPNSMRVIDFGEEPDGLLYIAMEYLEGRDLYRVIHEDWPLSNERIADIAMQALAALAVAHEMGVIHRDLKPENIMVLRTKDDEGNDADLVKVCDFGIAKITEKDETPKDQAANPAAQKLTTQGLVVGTPEYMSPEQARGEKLDPRSDLYSIGVILYQLLTGRTPFVGDTALSVVLKHITEPAPAPRTIYAGVHPALEAVCLRSLAKERDARFQTAREMRAALRSAIGGSQPPGPTSTAVRAAALVPSSAPPALSSGASVHPGAPTAEVPASALGSGAYAERRAAGSTGAPAVEAPLRAGLAPPRSRAPLAIAALLVGASAVGGLAFFATRDAKPGGAAGVSTVESAREARSASAPSFTVTTSEAPSADAKPDRGSNVRHGAGAGRRPSVITPSASASSSALGVPPASAGPSASTHDAAPSASHAADASSEPSDTPKAPTAGDAAAPPP